MIVAGLLKPDPMMRTYRRRIAPPVLVHGMSLSPEQTLALEYKFRTPDMGGRKPVRFLGFRARLRPRNASPIPCRGTWCESRSSPRKAFRGLAIDAAN